MLRCLFFMNLHNLHYPSARCLFVRLAWSRLAGSEGVGVAQTHGAHFVRKQHGCWLLCHGSEQRSQTGKQPKDLGVTTKEKTSIWMNLGTAKCLKYHIDKEIPQPSFLASARMTLPRSQGSWCQPGAPHSSQRLHHTPKLLHLRAWCCTTDMGRTELRWA